MHASSTPSRVIDSLHAFGFCMSYDWSNKVKKFVSIKMHSEFEKLALIPPEIGGLALIWDNMNLAEQHYEQRAAEPTQFVNGTVFAIRVLPPEARALASRASLDEGRERGSKEPFSRRELLNPAPAELVRQRAVFNILSTLLESEEFTGYKDRDAPELAPPPPVMKLSGGEKAKDRSYILAVEKLDESTYEGTVQIMEKYLEALGWDKGERRRWVAEEAVILLAGDGLTLERIQGLATMRAGDLNGWDRMNAFLASFGWFHVLMAIANSLHDQYLGTAAGFGINHAAATLKRKYIINIDKRQPWYHHLQEIILHMLEAHILECFLQAGKVESLGDLKTRTPEELKKLAEDVEKQYASSSALGELENREEKDEVLRNSIMFMRDALTYLELLKAIKEGDVGRMANLIPALLGRFQGGGNKNYALHFLDLMQCLHVEWKDDIK